MSGSRCARPSREKADGPEQLPLAASATPRSRQAEVLARTLGDQRRLGLGKLYARARKGDHARDHLTAATAMYREMDIRFYLEQAEAEFKESA